MGAKHTKGPWVIEDWSNTCGNTCFAIGVDHTNWGFCSHAEVRSGCDEADELGQVQANANLIAAAPDLLDVLERSLHLIEYMMAHDIADEARAAIAKAKGE